MKTWEAASFRPLIENTCLARDRDAPKPDFIKSPKPPLSNHKNPQELVRLT